MGQCCSIPIGTCKVAPGSAAFINKTKAKRSKEAENTSAFTQRQKKIVTQTWRILGDDLTGRGSKVFLKIFQLYPSVKQLFPALRDVEGDALLKNPTFRGHASRFMQAVGAAVENMDSPENLAPLLITLGRKHVEFPGFTGGFFEAFTEGMMFVWKEELGETFTPEVATVWKSLFDFIMSRLREGYTIAMSSASNDQDGNTTTDGKA